MPLSKTNHKTAPAPPPLIVGIGASAGGSEALQAMLGSLPDGMGISFIVVMHTDSIPASQLSEAIAKSSRLPVEEITAGSRIESGCIYVTPDHMFTSLKDGIFQLTPADQSENRLNPIDKLFYALGKDQGERAVAIILSGTGSDGAQGLKEISKIGGMTLAQAPTTAKYSEMPQNAIDTGAVDHVLAPVNLTEELLAYAQHLHYCGEKETFEKLREQVSNSLAEICEILLSVTGHNFRHYKVSTISRRIQRRIQVLRITTVQAYVERLRRDEAETRHLFNDLLIGVTAFFRDPDAFEALGKEVLSRIFKDNKPGEAVRIWVPGCATGEEAYTLAILVTEHMDSMAQKPEVQIFATDIDEAALGSARLGAFALSIAEEMSPERLKRHFVKKAQQYHINKNIRSLVLFSTHNLINDPPFSRLNLISCRNLLIYLGSHLQKKLIPLFHYALKSGGYLFLGPSENLSSHRELFRPVNAKYRISQRMPTAVQAHELFGNRNNPPTLAKPPNTATSSDTNTYLLMQRIILDEFAPKSLVVDEDGQILCASGNLEKYLTVSSGTFHNNAMRLVREGLRVGLRTTLAEAIKTRRQIVHPNLSLRGKDGVQGIMLTVQPMPHMGDDNGLFLVVFQDVGLPGRSETAYLPATEEAGALIEHLERELHTTREDLERTVQDLEAANEELKSSNEELLSMNEELQSTNEELETSKEEVQAANDTLNRVNNDLENLLASTQIATVFLDNAAHVRLVTPSAQIIYNLMPQDMGRPLTHFTHKAKYMPPLPSAAEIHAADKAIEHEIEMLDGTWYFRRILAYRECEGAHEGILLTFTDITLSKQSELLRRQNEDRLRLALSASRLGFLTWNIPDDSVIMSPRAAEIFGVDSTTSSWNEMKKSVHTDDRKRVQVVLEQSLEQKIDYMIEYRLVRPDGKFVWVLSTGHGEYDQDGKVTSMTRLVEDITIKKTAEERLIASERLYRAIGESIDYGVWICAPDGKNIYTSPSFLKLVGLTQEECSSFGWSKVLHPDELNPTIEEWKQCVTEGRDLWDRELRFLGVDGKWHSVLARGIPVKNDKGEITYWAGINLDITRIKRAEAKVRESEKRFRAMADSTPVLIWTAATDKHFTWFNKPWLDFTGRPLEKELGQGWMESVHPDDMDRCMQTYIAAFNAREAFRMEYRMLRHDGEYRWMLDNGTPLYGSNHEFIGYIGSCMDITDSKQSIDALKEADQRKDEFLATLAHELRNPLAPLSNGLQVIRMAGNTKPDMLQQAHGMMERQVKHMVRLVDDLLDVSRITRDQIELHRQRLELSSVIENALEFSQPIIDGKHHVLKINLPKDPIHVIADPTRLSQMISNLLNNAAKYTPDKGHLELTVTKSAHDALITVKDNGIGIPKEMLHKIFDVFVQVDTALERSQGGLGIGLTLVRKLVELHGGSISVHSDGAGKGCEFSISLPLPA